MLVQSRMSSTLEARKKGGKEKHSGAAVVAAAAEASCNNSSTIDGSEGGGEMKKNMKDEPGTLFHAAMAGDLYSIQNAILSGTDVNDRDRDGERSEPQHKLGTISRPLPQ